MMERKKARISKIVHAERNARIYLVLLLAGIGLVWMAGGCVTVAAVAKILLLPLP